ncbi:hypothetical protein B0T09DRAFT_333676 [Sordaria sp. MPI-SDFR-AT-0083]|nr:hypothetical protein B0T09DRAFT_333676 [Sordaria sp. MPI-SDFR-AT-0083]
MFFFRAVLMSIFPMTTMTSKKVGIGDSCPNRSFLPFFVPLLSFSLPCGRGCIVRCHQRKVRKRKLIRPGIIPAVVCGELSVPVRRTCRTVLEVVDRWFERPKRAMYPGPAIFNSLLANPSSLSREKTPKVRDPDLSRSITKQTP